MLGFAPLAAMPLAGGGFGPWGPWTATGHAWRRLLAQRDADAVLNRDAPHRMVWHDDEEEAIILAALELL